MSGVPLLCKVMEVITKKTGSRIRPPVFSFIMDTDFSKARNQAKQRTK